jgi:phosphoglycerate dehydrogenase-like enzyme
VLVTWPSFDPDGADTGLLLRQAGLQVRLAPKLGNRTAREVHKLVGNAVAAIVSTDPFDRAVFDSAPRLRAVARVGVGIDSIDIDAATEAGVVVTTTPGANKQTVADHTLALMLAAVRRVIENDASVRRSEWDRAGELTPWDLHGRRVGIVGFGDIGQAVAERLRGFGADLLVSDPAVQSQDGFELLQLQDLLARADIVTLHLPLAEATKHLIGPGEIDRMGSHTILVNTSRGGLVEEHALTDALAAGRLRGAALDVFEDEPPPSQKLRQLHNVVLSPHIAGLSDASIAVMTQQATRSVLDALAGRSTPAVRNPAVFDRHRREAIGRGLVKGAKRSRQ